MDSNSIMSCSVRSDSCMSCLAACSPPENNTFHSTHAYTVSSSWGSRPATSPERPVSLRPRHLLRVDHGVDLSQRHTEAKAFSRNSNARLPPPSQSSLATSPSQPTLTFTTFGAQASKAAQALSVSRASLHRRREGLASYLPCRSLRAATSPRRWSCLLTARGIEGAANLP
eukprot:752899-Hanusia_phi.AAC.2